MEKYQMNLEQAQNIGALFRELAQAFEEIGVDFGKNPVVMSAAQYIDELPSDGPVTTNGPAEVFNSGADVAAVFAPAPQGEPVYTMTEAAAGHSRESLLAGGLGWTDELLISQNMMTVEYVLPKPAVPVAPPAPAPVAPPTPAASTPSADTPTPAAIELDSTGLPWDARIHSGGRTKTQKGVWVSRKGVQPNVVSQVTAELRSNPPRANAPFVPQQEAHVPLAQPAAAAAPTPAPAAPAPATAGEAVAQAKAAAAGITDARSLMQWVSSNGHGPNMAAVGALMGFTHFGAVMEPANAGRIGEAYNHFMTLKG